MAAPKPSIKRRPSADALAFVEGSKASAPAAEASSKAKAPSRPSKAPRAKAPSKATASSKAPSSKVQRGGRKGTPKREAGEQEERTAKRLYIPKEVDKVLKLRAIEEGVQQSEIATLALKLYLGL